MDQTILQIEQNLKSRNNTDRIMWFSMWIVMTVASFGIAWFPMIFFLIKRRNDHFNRQQKFELLVLRKLEKTNKSKNERANSDKIQERSRSEKGWTFSTLLIVPAFHIFNFLKIDLKQHEEHEHNFLSKIIDLTKNIHCQRIAVNNTVNKLYILNDYNYTPAVEKLYNDLEQYYDDSSKFEGIYLWIRHMDYKTNKIVKRI